MSNTVYDAVVVGSGATGGWAAKILAEKGLKVLVLEAGRKVDPSKEYTDHQWPYELPYRGFGNQDELQRTQPVQALCYACNEYGSQFFVNDLEHPYTTPPDKPFTWIRSRQVGGRTIPWGRQSYRLSDYDFKAASRDGYGDDWPISYSDLAPYYDRVEELGVPLFLHPTDAHFLDAFQGYNGQLYSALPRLYPRVKAVHWLSMNNLKHAMPGRQLNNYSLLDEPAVAAQYARLRKKPADDT